MPQILLTLLNSILPDVIKRVLPAEKVSEAEQANLQAQLTLAMMGADWQQIEAEYADRASARALAAAEIAKGNAFTSLMAASVRPLWGIGAFVLVAYSVGTEHAIAEPLQSIIQSVLAFYFGGRVIEKIAPTIALGLKK
jgi:hypothetical protein